MHAAIQVGEGSWRVKRESAAAGGSSRPSAPGESLLSCALMVCRLAQQAGTGCIRPDAAVGLACIKGRGRVLRHMSGMQPACFRRATYVLLLAPSCVQSWIGMIAYCQQAQQRGLCQSALPAAQSPQAALGTALCPTRVWVRLSRHASSAVYIQGAANRHREDEAHDMHCCIGEDSCTLRMGIQTSCQQ